MLEELPAAAGNAVVHCLRHERRTEVGYSADDEGRDPDLAKAVYVFEILQCPGRSEFVRAPSAEVRLVAVLLRPCQAFGRVLRDGIVAVAAHVFGNGGFVCSPREVLSVKGMADSLLHILRHELYPAEPFLLPEAAAGMSARDDVGLDAFWLAVHRVADLHHSSPGLADDVALLDSQVFAQSFELVHPRLLCPELRMPFEEGIPAADLVVHYDLAVVQVSDTVKHFEIVVGRTRPSVEAEERGFPVIFLFAYDSVVGLVAEERHVAFCDLCHVGCQFMFSVVLQI